MRVEFRKGNWKGVRYVASIGGGRVGRKVGKIGKVRLSSAVFVVGDR